MPEMTLFKSVAAIIVGRGYLSADHLSTATGLDPAIMISKNGANFANPAAGASVMTEIEATGWYKFSLGVADTDTLGPLIIRGTHATMDNIEVVYQVVDAGVVLASSQGAITWAQQKIVANAANEGALDIRNSHADGIGQYNQGGDVGLYNDGTALYGQYNVGADTGLYNNGTGAGAYGNYNVGVAIGQYNAGSGAASAGQTNQGVVNGISAVGGTNDILGDITGNLDGTIDGLTTDALADFFDTDSGETSATAIDGSVVKEIMDGLCAPTVFPAGAINFTYTITDSVTTLPIEGVEVWISTDNPAVNIVWKGDTDAFGVARDVNGDLPALDAGTYYFWRQKVGYTFSDPDTEVVS